MLKIKISRRFLSFFLFLLALCLLISTAPYLARRAYPFHHRPIILAGARSNNLEPLLIVAVIYVESSFDEKALSNKGARGLMQIMPETGLWVAGKLDLEDFTAEQLFEPRANIAIGTRYLGDLLEQFEGNVFAALAAYNSGPNYVRHWLQKGVWDGRLETIHNIPFPETRFFVLKVERIYQRYRWIYREPDLLGVLQPEKGFPTC